MYVLFFPCGHHKLLGGLIENNTLISIIEKECNLRYDQQPGDANVRVLNIPTVVIVVVIVADAAAAAAAAAASAAATIGSVISVLCGSCGKQVHANGTS